MDNLTKTLRASRSMLHLLKYFNVFICQKFSIMYKVIKEMYPHLETPIDEYNVICKIAL